MTLAAGDLVVRDGQIEWRGLLLGVGTVYARQGLDGWLDLPGIDNASTPRSGQHGSTPGRLLAQERIVEAQLQVAAPGDPTAIDALVDVLALYQEETPLVVQAHGRRLMANGRVLRRRIPMDRLFAVGIGKVTVQWECTDPRRYELAERVAVTGLPQAESGLTWPLTWPLDWGTPAVTGNVTVNNTGKAPTSPVIEFAGPVDVPALVRLSDGARLEYDITVGPGETLTVDTAAGTVQLNGADRLYTASSRSAPEEWFELGPGATDLAFRAYPGSSDPAATMTVRWRSAHW